MQSESTAIETTTQTQNISLLIYVTEKFISLVCQLNRSFHQASASAVTPAIANLYFYSNNTDAKQTLPSFSDPSFYPSLVQQALQAKSFDVKQELRQFNADISRHQNILSDGVIIEHNETKNLLVEWATQISIQTGIPLERVKFAISTLHQGVGNSAMAFMSTIQTIKNGTPISIYRPLRESDLYASMLIKDGNKISMKYTLPIQLVSDSYDEDIECCTEHDMLITSTVSITFIDDYIKMQSDPDSVTHTMQLSAKKPEVTFLFDNVNHYNLNTRLDGFELVDVQEPNDLLSSGWVMAPRI